MYYVHVATMIQKQSRRLEKLFKAQAIEIHKQKEENNCLEDENHHHKKEITRSNNEIKMSILSKLSIY